MPRLLADHAARILSQVELAQSDIEAQRGEVVGEVRICAFPTAARGLFPAMLSSLRADHPDLTVRTRELEPEQGLRAVLRGDVDLAVVLDWSNKRLPVPGGLAKAELLDDAPDIAMPWLDIRWRTVTRWSWRTSRTTSGCPGPRANSVTSG